MLCERYSKEIFELFYQGLQKLGTLEIVSAERVEDK